MKAVFFCAAVLAAAPVFADDLVARQGDDSVRLGEAPCTSELVLSRLQQNMRGDFKAASATVGGQKFNACWRVMGNAALLLYEDGDQGLIPLGELKPELAA